ncbi:MAG: hypothetical protein ABW019_18295 [Chitinophagaceae bacterium]
MIKLKLPESLTQFHRVKELPGLAGLPLDPSFGLVPIDPRQSLYVVRSASIDDLDHRRKLSPEIIEAYGDIRISTT